MGRPSGQTGASSGRHIEGRLYWEQVGSTGRPIVFLHPNPMDRRCWLYQVAHFSEWFRTVAIDLPGYGRSPRASAGLTMTELADACWMAVDEATSDPAIVVGVSTGSGAAIYMAQQRPDRTLALVLSGARYRRASSGSADDRVRKYRELGARHRCQHTLEDFSPAFRRTDLARYFADLFAVQDADPETYLNLVSARSDPEPDWVHQGVKAPTLIIAGSEDKQYRSAQVLAEHIAGAEFVTMEGAGHACNMERPWEWDALFLDFLRRHDLLSAEITIAATMRGNLR